MEAGEKDVNEENEIEQKCGEERGKNTMENKGGERKKIKNFRKQRRRKRKTKK